MNCIGISKNNSAVEALEEFEAAYDAFENAADHESDTQGEALMASYAKIDELNERTPEGAAVLLVAWLEQGSTAYPTEESGIPWDRLKAAGRTLMLQVTERCHSDSLLR